MANFFDNYIYPAIVCIVFTLSAFYLTDIFSSVPVGIGGGLLITILVAACIELTKECPDD